MAVRDISIGKLLSGKGANLMPATGELSRLSQEGQVSKVLTVMEINTREPVI
jgi:hypothetical protein